MARDHFDKLGRQATDDPQFQPLLDFGKPYYDRFVEQYRSGKTESATYRMRTQAFEDMMEELRGKRVRNWDVRVQVKYDIESPEYAAIFPEGRAPFQKGAYDLRINETFSLADRLQAFSDLSELEGEVREFAKKADELRSLQQGEETVEQGNSSELERTRKALAQAMHGIFGRLLGIYFDRPEEVEKFYELKYFKYSKVKDEEEKPRISLSLELPAGEATKVLEEELKAGDLVRILNEGDFAFEVSFENEESTTIVVAAGQDVVLEAKAGDTTLITKTNAEQVGKALVEVL